MVSSKATTLLPALSTRFARSFGFSLDGAASCLQSRACSVWASSGTCCGSEEAIPIETITGQTGPRRTARQAENVASALVEGGNGFLGGYVPRAGVPSSPAGSACLPLSHHSPILFSSPAVSWVAAQPYRMLCRGVRTLAADIKTGNVVEIKGKLQEVTKTVWTMQGRGGSSIQVELREIGVKGGTKNVDKWRPDQAVERVILEDRDFTFLYDDGASAVLMDPHTFEQAAVDKAAFGEAAIFLKDGMPVKVAYHGETAVQASLPSQVRCTVVDAAATFKGERKTASTKMVTLDTGARIQVPGFIEQGEDVLVKTSDQTFVARAKGE